MRRGVKEIDFIGKLQEVQDALSSVDEEVPEVTSGSIIINEANDFTFDWQMITENDKSYLNATLKIKSK